MVVQEAEKPDAPVEQQSGSEGAVSVSPSAPRTGPYQQVVVEENPSAKVSASSNGEKGASSLHRPKSYENVSLKENSSSSGSVQPVEEESQGVKNVSAEQGGSDLQHSGDSGASVGADSQTGPSVPPSEGGGVNQQTTSCAAESSHVDQVDEDHTDSHVQVCNSQSHPDGDSEVNGSKKIVCARESSTSVSKEEVSSEHKPQNSPHIPLRKERPPRPSVTPPSVRPKPRKRVSLLKQSKVAEEDLEQPSTSPATGEATPSQTDNTSVAADVTEPCASKVHSVGEITDPPVSKDSSVREVTKPHVTKDSSVSEVTEPNASKDNSEGQVKELHPSEDASLDEAEGTGQPQAVTDTSVPQSETPLYDVVYQEIDELEHSGHSLTTEESHSCKTKGPPDQNGTGSVLDVSDSSHESEEVKKASAGEVNHLGDSEEGSCENKRERDTSLQQEEDIAEPSLKDRDTNSAESSSQAVHNITDGQKDSPGTHAGTSEKDPISLQDVGETSFMLKEIEALLNARLGSGEAVSSVETKPRSASDAVVTSQTSDSPVRPPRPKRDKLRKLTLGSSSVDSSSTESLTSVGEPGGKKAPPKPKRKLPPGAVNRSLSDVTGLKSYVDQLSKEGDDDNKEDEEEEKPFLPPRQQSLRLSTEPKPPPLPPRNKSMERAPEDGPKQGLKPSDRDAKTSTEPSGGAADRRASAPNVGAATPIRMTRSASGAKPGKKHVARPTRKAPPPPPHPPSRPLSMNQPQGTPTPSASEGAPADRVPGYQKIANGCAGEDIDTVVPKTNVVGSVDSPSAGDVSVDHDYHEIPDHLVKELSQAQKMESPPEKSKEGTPPPDLPPRSYRPPSQLPTITTSDPQTDNSSENASLSESASSGKDTSQVTQAGSLSPEGVSDVAAHSPEDGQDHLSAEDSNSQSSQRSSRPESFCNEVLGLLQQQRPISTHSGSSHSETGSGEAPTFDQSSGSESENEDDEEKLVSCVRTCVCVCVCVCVCMCVCRGRW